MTNYLSLVDAGRFEELFEELGWGFVPRGVQPVTVDFEGGKKLTARPIADQSGLRVWVVKSAKLPAPTEQRLVDAAVNKVSQVRLVIFTDGKNQSWRWPRRGATAATNTKLLHHRYEVGNEELGADLARRLEMIELPIGEKIGILEIQERMAKAFNNEAVKRSHEASGHMRVMNEQLLDAGCTTDASSSLLVRLLFLFFGDDTNMWPDDAFKKWVLHHTTAESIHEKLTELFEVLCDPELDKALDRKGRYADTEYKDFRRIDGMYKERIELPPLTEDFRQQVLKACDFDWGKVNPDIFGAMFQQLVDLEDLRKNGEHYTSEENIMKVIEPLFLDEYRARFEHVYNDRKKLLALQDELATLKFLDPACGCGNFLIQAYKHLRGLEYEIIVRAEELEVAEINSELDEKTGQRDSERKRKLRRRLQEIESGGFINFGEDALRKSKLSMRQFHGIEINDWPAKVASTAMLLVDHLCNQVWGQSVVRLPIEHTPEIRTANALQLNWNSVVSAEECSFIMGNPPFLGARNQSKSQKAELREVFPPGTKNIGNIDYVAGWFIKAAKYVCQTKSRVAFVSTNSVVQGEQVANIWYPICELGISINFAYDTFRWNSEAQTAASVYCVIVGFSAQERQPVLFRHTSPISEPERLLPDRINPYLADAPDVFIWSRSKPISNVPKMGIGSQPIDDGNFIFTEAEKNEFLLQEPAAEAFFYPFIGSREFINGQPRWALWLGKASDVDMSHMPLAQERVDKVRKFREQSKRAQTKKAAKYPKHFGTEIIPDSTSILIPETSSERRRILPIGFIGPEILTSNAVRLIPNATLYQFGILCSQFHNAWVRAVGGRLKSDLRYSAGVVYNNFVFPNADPSQRAKIEESAQDILWAREHYSNYSLAELYDPDREKEFESLYSAHRELDYHVERAYDLDLSELNWADKEKAIVTRLFELHAALGED